LYHRGLARRSSSFIVSVVVTFEYRDVAREWRVGGIATAERGS
jgi:hypothetical protein